LAVLDVERLSADRQHPIRLRPGDGDDSDRRQGLLPFHRLPAARSSHCRATITAASIAMTVAKTIVRATAASQYNRRALSALI